MRLFALLPLIVACGGSAPVVEVEAPPVPRVVRVLTHNVWMLPPVSRDNLERARAIPDTLHGHDAVVLTEVFERAPRDTILQAIQQRGWHASPVLGQGAPDQCESRLGPIAISTPLGLNGGVLIVSPHPIDATAEKIFRDEPMGDDFACLGEDCCAAKGVLYARIRAPEGCLHVFGTHLQNQAPAIGRRRGDPAAVRTRQLQIVRELIDEIDLEACPGPAFVAGDLNLQPHELAEAAEILGAYVPDHFEGPRSWGDDNAYSQSDEPEHLDYVLVTRDFERPVYSLNETRRARSTHAFTRGSGLIGIQREGVLADLSDHHPVAGHFEWNVALCDHATSDAPPAGVRVTRCASLATCGVEGPSRCLQNPEANGYVCFSAEP